MKKISLFVLILLISGCAFSQHSSVAYRKHGDTQFKHHHYQSAIGFYLKALKKSPEAGYVMIQLAKSYIKTNQPNEAEKWFIEARANNAEFTIADYYQYARVLVTLKKRSQADALLEHLVATDPNSYLARRALSDLRDFEKYYRDSLRVRVDSLSINSTVAEFAPVYYKEGIVFSSARSEGPLRKKYHWDNSHFLNLYFSSLSGDTRLGTPVLFEKDLNTRHHEGPAMFYGQYKRMILNRNQSVTVEGSEDIYERKLALFDAVIDEGKSTWKVTPLPFNTPAYSFAHPSISEDGNTLYFISDEPGGYGGTDIYRVVRANGVWGTPFNLGPVINSAENEVFPFFYDNTLYFSSNGHGGIGGLDLFESTQTVNGFSPPANMGYPMNSSGDDFSLITRLDQRKGYFSSSRTGNDDLYYFEKPLQEINIAAHIYDSLTQKPLSAANIQIITSSGNDSTLTADIEGNFSFKVPEETAYVIIGTKDNKIGIASDIADQSKNHRIPAYGDTSRVACIGFIVNQDSLPKIASLISILDETTGQKIDHPGDLSQITFLGEKGHNYKVDIQDDAGHQASHRVEIGLTDKDPKVFTMVLPDALPLNMAARVFNGDDDQPLANAKVTVITFGEDDQELTTDDKGMVDFKLKEGTTFLIEGKKDNLSGMTSGVAERGVNDKDSQIIPVPLYGDKKGVTALGLVTNRSGDPVDGFKAVVTNKKTGQTVPVETKKGLMSFKGEPGESFNISVSHNDYLPTLQEVILPENGPDVHKFTVILENKSSGIPLALPLVAAQSVTIADNIKSGKSELITLDTDKGTSKMYIQTGGVLSEITERDSSLYHETPRGNEYLGKGGLTDLRTNPSSVLQGIKRSDMTRLRNIYFDFDKADLDPDDEKYLGQVKSILERDLTSKLIIAGHADDRGTDEYNVKLSERRVLSVSKFLIAAGIPKERIVLRAFGEALPVVPCHGEECTEAQHQKNRRAEFVLSQEDVIAPTRLEPEK